MQDAHEFYACDAKSGSSLLIGLVFRASMPSRHHGMPAPPDVTAISSVDADARTRWHSACYDPDMNEMHANRSWLPIDPDDRANR